MKIEPYDVGALAGLYLGHRITPTHAVELFAEYKPRTVEAWRQRMRQRTTPIPVLERIPPIVATALVTSLAIEFFIRIPEFGPLGSLARPRPGRGASRALATTRRATQRTRGWAARARGGVAFVTANRVVAPLPDAVAWCSAKRSDALL